MRDSHGKEIADEVIRVENGKFLYGAKSEKKLQSKKLGALNLKLRFHLGALPYLKEIDAIIENELPEVDNYISILLARKAATKVKENKSQPSSQSKSQNQLITQFLSVASGTETEKSAEEDASTSAMDLPEDDSIFDTYTPYS